MAHGSRFRSGWASGGSRRKTAWGVGPQEPGASISTAGLTLWQLGSQALADGLTVARVRGELMVNQTATTTIGDGFRSVVHGICIVSENAFGIGITAVPTPLTDMAWDGWLWHHMEAGTRGFSVTELGVTPSESYRVVIDSKVMRKTRASDVLIGVTEVGTEVGTATLVLQAITRVLDLIP